MKSTFLSIGTLSIVLLFSSCENKKEQKKMTVETNTIKKDSALVNGIPSDITISGVHFTKALNGAEKLATADENGKVTFKAGEKQDYFCDPDGKLSNNTAPVLLCKIDNTKPFTLISKVTPEFTEKGLYNAGVLYLYVNDNYWQKLCFEQDEHGKHRIVSVRTIGTSDDNNHDVITAPSIYMKISSDTHTVASYYSYDKITWQMVRLYKNDYPKELWVGISNQCPMEKESVSYFEDISLTQNTVTDFRLGN